MSFIRQSSATFHSGFLSLILGYLTEASMFFGLLNHALTWNRPQRFFNENSFVFFPFLTHIIKCLFIIATNRWVHCNAYKRLKVPAFVALFHFCTCDNLDNLKLSWITKSKLQNQTLQQFLLLKKCSFVHFGHIWHLGRLREVYV